MGENLTFEDVHQRKLAALKVLETEAVEKQDRDALDNVTRLKDKLVKVFQRNITASSRKVGSTSTPAAGCTSIVDRNKTGREDEEELLPKKEKPLTLSEKNKKEPPVTTGETGGKRRRTTSSCSEIKKVKKRERKVVQQQGSGAEAVVKNSEERETVEKLYRPGRKTVKNSEEREQTLVLEKEQQASRRGEVVPVVQEKVHPASGDDEEEESYEGMVKTEVSKRT